MKAQTFFVLKVLFPKPKCDLGLSLDDICAKPRTCMQFLIPLFGNIQNFSLSFRRRGKETCTNIYKCRLDNILNSVRLVFS